MSGLTLIKIMFNNPATIYSSSSIGSYLTANFYRYNFFIFIRNRRDLYLNFWIFEFLSFLSFLPFFKILIDKYYDNTHPIIYSPPILFNKLKI